MNESATETASPSPPGATPGGRGERRRAWWGGALAAGLALAVGEVAAGLLVEGASLVGSVGDVVIDFSPSFVRDWAIDLLGTNDKPALVIGIVVVSLVAGGALGRLATTRPVPAAAAFAAFGVLGFFAGARQTEWDTVAAIVTAVLAALAGMAALVVLTRLAAGAAEADGSRRGFLVGAGSVAGLTLFAVAGSRLLNAELRRQIAQSRDEVVLPEGIVEAAPPAQPPPPVDGIAPLVTPNADFYRIDTALNVPRIDPVTWSLKVTGMVDREIELTYDDLLARDLIEHYVTLACVSNRVGGDLVGNARWLGVPLAEILDEAGVHDGATQVVGRAVDGFTVGFPTAVALDGRVAMVAVGMNDEALPFTHGFPARLIVAGLYGYVSATKWLAEIELTTLEAFDAYWVPRGWAKEAPIKTQSRIDVPGGDVAAGRQAIAGVAWAPHRGISRVEVRIDEEDWREAELGEQLTEDAWVQWWTEWDAQPGSHRIAVRATDGTGETQPEERLPARPDGATGHHTISVTVG